MSWLTIKLFQIMFVFRVGDVSILKAFLAVLCMQIYACHEIILPRLTIDVIISLQKLILYIGTGLRRVILFSYFPQIFVVSYINCLPLLTG